MLGENEKINVSSLLQIRRRLKSHHNPQRNQVWFEDLLVEPGSWLAKAVWLESVWKLTGACRDQLFVGEV